MPTYKFSDSEKSFIIERRDDGSAKTINTSSLLYRQLVDGVAANEDLGIGAIPPTPIADWVAPDITVNDVSAEAERRIELGTLIGGVQVRCDAVSIGRLRDLVSAFAAGRIGVDGRTYMTAGGVPITFANLAQADAVYAAATDFVDQILARSAELQLDLSLLQGQPADDANWP